MNVPKLLVDHAATIAQQLIAADEKLVLAESCTSGLVAVALSQIPGISRCFCGSFVTYRESLKTDAIGVDPKTLAQHTAVSVEASAEMLVGALSTCTESTIGLAITGHLGPDAPSDLDGKVFVAVGRRGNEAVHCSIQLSDSGRHDRQLEAAIAALQQLKSLLN